MFFEKDMKIKASSESEENKVVIGTYEYGKWCHVTLVCNFVTNVYEVLIDGVSARSGIPMHPSVRPTELSLISGNIGVNEIYFDDVIISSTSLSQEPVDETPPGLSAGVSTRISDSEAIITFSSNESCEYYYAVVEHGDPAPDMDTNGAGISCDTSTQTVELSSLTPGDKDIYIIANDQAGNLSQPLKMSIDTFVLQKQYWTDGITSTSQYPFGGRDGSSPAEAYEISTPEQLAQLAYNVNGRNSYTDSYFRLTADIDLSGKEWVPIGYRVYPSAMRQFCGVFDGEGHQITNVVIGTEDNPKVGDEQSQAGLFGCIGCGGEIKNVNVEVYIHTKSVCYVGGLVGYMESDKPISNCSSYGSISFSGSQDVGGLIGGTVEGNVTDCTSDVDLYGWCSKGLGGVLGYFGAHSYNGDYRSLDRCIFTGSIESTGSNYVGGIAGEAYGYCIVKNCINRGYVSGRADDIGGILGKLDAVGLLNCYSSGDVSADCPWGQCYAGGLVGTSGGGAGPFTEQGDRIEKVCNCYTSGRVTAQVGGNGTACVGTVVGFNKNTAAASNCYGNSTVNGDLPVIGNNEGAVSYVSNITDEQMRGLVPGDIQYAPGLFATGNGAFVVALNGWLDVQTEYPSQYVFCRWNSEPSYNYGYPYLVGVEEPVLTASSELKSISVSGATLLPTFSPGTLEYSASVENSVDSVGVSVEPVDSEASVTINGTVALSKEIPLSVGNNCIMIIVRANGGISKKTYTINITKKPPADVTPEPPSEPTYKEDSSDIEVSVTQESGRTITKVDVPARLTPYSCKADVDSEMIDALLQRAKLAGGTTKRDFLQVDITGEEGTKAVEVQLNRSDLEKIASQTDARFAIASSIGSVSFDKKALEIIRNAGSGDHITVFASVVDSSLVSAKDRGKLEGRPAYTFKVTNGEVEVSNFSPGRAIVTVPYEVGSSEEPDAIVVYALLKDGNLKIVPGNYSANSKSVAFNTSYFTDFVIGHNLVYFSDLPEDAWYKKALTFVGARDILPVTVGEEFKPYDSVKRGEFVLMLVNAFGIDSGVSESGIDNFEDVENTYYADYVLAAKQLGIVRGVGNNRFVPDAPITRQEGLVMVYNCLKAQDEIPSSTWKKGLQSFSDADTVSEWAVEAVSCMVKAGIVQGDGRYLQPRSIMTRSQAVQILYNLLKQQ